MIDMVARAMASKALLKNGSEQYKNKTEFPSIGEDDRLYIDSDENMIYYWDNLNSMYRSLNISIETETIAKEAVVEVLEKEILDGGNY